MQNAKTTLSTAKPAENPRLWTWIMIIVGVCIAFAGIYWITAHPYSVGWDEAYYVNHAVRDHHAFTRSFRDGIDSLFFNGRAKPFAYRVIALPYNLIFGPDVRVLRLSSFACFFAAAGFIYYTAKRLYGVSGACFASLLFLLSPEAIAASVRFYAEAGLYLAVASMLYFLLRLMQETRPCRVTWLGLGVSLGLGMLAKLSFVLMAAIPLCIVFVVKIEQGMSKETMSCFLKAGLTALVIAVLWWIKNYAHALGHMKAAEAYTPFCLAPGGPQRLVKYGFFFIQNIVGYLTAVACLCAIATMFLFQPDKQNNTGGPQRFMLWVCLFCGLPLLTAQLFTVNHCMRLASPAMVPLAVILAFFFSRRQGKYHTAIHITLACLFLLQTAAILSSLRYRNEPVQNLWETCITKTLPLREQWDWGKVRDVTDSYGIKNPAIGLLGTAAPMKPSNVLHPWVVENEHTIAELISISEGQQDDFNKFLSFTERYDVIITILDYPFMNVRNLAEKNALNSSFIDNVRHNSSFHEPVYIQVGRYNETTLAICVKK